MSAFKNRSLKILVGTDIISRGIDVVGIELVINYDTPSDPEDYVHRVGRTARADSQGEAITFVNEKDKFKYANIEKLIGMEIDKIPIPEHLGEAPSFASPTRPDRAGRNAGKKSNSKKPRAGIRSGNKTGGGARPKFDPAKQKPRRENITAPTAEKRSGEARETAPDKPRFRSRKNVQDGE